MSDVQGMVVLYHGTDLTSVMDILKNGLDEQRLTVLQANRKTQSRPGWYVTYNFAAAWYFASIAPGNKDKYAVIEVKLFVEHLEMLIDQGLAQKSKVLNVLFAADQICFDFQAFTFLNTHALFRPCQMEED